MQEEEFKPLWRALEWVNTYKIKVINIGEYRTFWYHGGVFVIYDDGLKGRRAKALAYKTAEEESEPSYY